MKEVTKLKVEYWHEDIDSVLDEKIKSALAMIGFENYATGYDLRKQRRDLCFEKKGTNEEGSNHAG